MITPTCGELSCEQCNERTAALLSERDGLRKENQRLNHRIELLECLNSHVGRIVEKCDKANDKINRLEKAGDDMYDLLSNCHETLNWNKAKKSKP